MRTLHGQFAPPFLPSQANHSDIHNIDTAAAVNDHALQDNDQQQLIPSPQSLAVLVNSLLASHRVDTTQPPPLDLVPDSEDASCLASTDGSQVASEQAQYKTPQPSVPTGQQHMSIQSLLSAVLNSPPSDQEGQQSVQSVKDLTFMASHVETPATATSQVSTTYPDHSWYCGMN